MNLTHYQIRRFAEQDEGRILFPLNIKMDAATAWYAAHLTGFKKILGYESGRAQTAFYNSGGTIVIFLTGIPALKVRT